jgi:hypothetical protein
MCAGMAFVAAALAKRVRSSAGTFVLEPAPAGTGGAAAGGGGGHGHGARGAASSVSAATAAPGPAVDIAARGWAGGHGADNVRLRRALLQLLVHVHSEVACLRVTAGHICWHSVTGLLSVILQHCLLQGSSAQPPHGPGPPAGLAAAAAAAGASPLTTEERLGQVLVRNQSFRTSVLWELHARAPPDVVARFLLCAFTLNDPLERLVAAVAALPETTPVGGF